MNMRSENDDGRCNNVSLERMVERVEASERGFLPNGKNQRGMWERQGLINGDEFGAIQIVAFSDNDVCVGHCHTNNQ